MAKRQVFSSLETLRAVFFCACWGRGRKSITPSTAFYGHILFPKFLHSTSCISTKTEVEGDWTFAKRWFANVAVKHTLQSQKIKAHLSFALKNKKIGLDQSYKATQSPGFMLQSWKTGLLFQTVLYFSRLLYCEGRSRPICNSNIQ